MLDLYSVSYLGPTNQAIFNATGGANRRYLLGLPTGAAEALYMIRADQNLRILQGGVAVNVAATDTLIMAYELFPLRVSNAGNAYISIVGATANAGTLTLTIISDVRTWTIAAA